MSSRFHTISEHTFMEMALQTGFADKKNIRVNESLSVDREIYDWPENLIVKGSLIIDNFVEDEKAIYDQLIVNGDIFVTAKGVDIFRKTRSITSLSNMKVINSKKIEMEINDIDVRGDLVISSSDIVRFKSERTKVCRSMTVTSKNIEFLNNKTFVGHNLKLGNRITGLDNIIFSDYFAIGGEFEMRASRMAKIEELNDSLPIHFYHNSNLVFMPLNKTREIFKFNHQVKRYEQAKVDSIEYS